MITDEMLLVSYNGRSMYYLNRRLVIEQRLELDDVVEIKRLHIEKLELFEKMHDTDNPDTLKDLASEVENIEYTLQQTWRFPRDAGMHEWYNVPKCTCPKMDNRDRRYPGSKTRIYNNECLVHGGFA